MHAVSDSLEHLKYVPEIELGKFDWIFVVLLRKRIDHVLEHRWLRRAIGFQLKRPPRVSSVLQVVNESEIILPGAFDFSRLDFTESSFRSTKRLHHDDIGIESQTHCIRRKFGCEADYKTRKLGLLLSREFLSTESGIWRHHGGCLPYLLHELRTDERYHGAGLTPALTRANGAYAPFASW